MDYSAYEWKLRFSAIVASAIAVTILLSSIKENDRILRALRKDVNQSRRLTMFDPKTFVEKKDAVSRVFTAEKIRGNTPVSVFYNVWLSPDDSEKADLGKKIIEEQIEQVAKSGLANRTHVTLNIVTIGAPVDESFLTDICGKNHLYCIHVKHYEKGFEMVTQQHLLEYCQVEENQSHTVSYIHTKGSFHSSAWQDKLRRKSMEPVLSDECLSLLDGDTCNSCGGAFRIYWGPFYFANFWSAKCEYVKHLVSPNEIETKMQEAFDSKPKGMTINKYTKQIPASMGKNRFAAEIFIGTHPRLVPCEPSGIIQPGPPQYRSTQREEPGAAFTPDMAVTGWYYLPGLLWRYYKLYDEMPPPESWVWSFYPEGERWRDAVEQFGYPRANEYMYNKMLEEKRLEKTISSK